MTTQAEIAAAVSRMVRAAKASDRGENDFQSARADTEFECVIVLLETIMEENGLVPWAGRNHHDQ